MAENSLLDPPLEEGGYMPPMDGEGPLMDFDIGSHNEGRTRLGS